MDTAAALAASAERSDDAGECSFMYRYMLREYCSQFDALPLTSLTISPPNDDAELHDALRTEPRTKFEIGVALARAVDAERHTTAEDPYSLGGGVRNLLTMYGVVKQRKSAAARRGGGRALA